MFLQGSYRLGTTEPGSSLLSVSLAVPHFRHIRWTTTVWFSRQVFISCANELHSSLPAICLFVEAMGLEPTTNLLTARYNRSLSSVSQGSPTAPDWSFEQEVSARSNRTRRPPLTTSIRLYHGNGSHGGSHTPGQRPGLSHVTRESRVLLSQVSSAVQRRHCLGW
jgi:hypothetical protein